MFKRMLVPIDGSHASASVVPYAADLAQRLGCRVDLLLVEPPQGATMPHPDHHRPARQNGHAATLVVGTGTTVRENVPAGSLAVSAGKQRNIEGWAERKRPPQTDK